MPITRVIYRILFEDMDLTEAIRELTERPPRSE